MNLNRALVNLILERPLERDECSSLIHQVLLDGNPAMIARFGSVEIKGVLYPRLPLLARKALERKIFAALSNNAGFFPARMDYVTRFSELMFADMRELDILGSWRVEERLVRKNFKAAKLVALYGLEPYLSRNPWSQGLAGKKVLVVHPFNATIERQYQERREFLFRDSRVLPQFASLRTVKAVQTIAGNKSEFDDWFAALEYMKSAIDACDYEVAILGCGAYGFPLAAHVKRNGKQAIHLGGATQILFGIRGRRWDSHPVISQFYNEHWVRPAAEDVPHGSSNVENGCYW